jgi:hypothetical protein
VNALLEHLLQSYCKSICRGAPVSCRKGLKSEVNCPKRTDSVKKILAFSGFFPFLFAGVSLRHRVDTVYYRKTTGSAPATSTEMIRVNVTFSLYDAPTGGDLLWSGTKPVEANSATGPIQTDLGDSNRLRNSLYLFLKFAGDLSMILLNCVNISGNYRHLKRIIAMHSSGVQGGANA